jgi:hypothetical protein
MGVRRRDVLVTVASLLIIMSCGGGGGGGSPPATTTLPLQQDALAVGADVRERARDVVKTRMTEDQLRQVTEVCRKAKITDRKDPCVQLLKSIAESGGGPCGPRDLCMTLYDISDLDASDLDSTGVAFMEITDRRPGSVCASGPANVCLRAGLETSGLLDQIVASAESTTSPGGTTTTTSTSPETTPATPPVTTSPSTSASTSVPTSTSAPESTSASTTPP